MEITPIKTHKITKKDKSILEILDKYLDEFENNSILVVTSKIISITEGRIVPVEGSNKDELVEQESEYYLPKEENKYGFHLTITQNLLIPAAGIDESNGNGFYILWPENPFQSANKIREYLVNRFRIKHAGVIITDSKTTPLRWGTTGVAISYSGFKPLKDYIGKPDLFNREMRVTTSNIMDGLAAGAVSIMGEGQEQTPIAVISDISNVEFVDRNPTEEEIENLKIDLETDVYSSILKRAPWKKGKKERLVNRG